MTDDNINSENNGKKLPMNMNDWAKKSIPSFDNNAILSLGFMPKPFGCTWSSNQMKDFLEKRGYIIMKKYSIEFDEDYYVAFKEDDKYIPDEGISNLLEKFTKEVQTIILNYLLKIGKDDK